MIFGFESCQALYNVPGVFTYGFECPPGYFGSQSMRFAALLTELIPSEQLPRPVDFDKSVQKLLPVNTRLPLFPSPSENSSSIALGMIRNAVAHRKDRIASLPERGVGTKVVRTEENWAAAGVLYGLQT